jgi:hypothetical protein
VDLSANLMQQLVWPGCESQNKQQRQIGQTILILVPLLPSSKRSLPLLRGTPDARSHDRELLQTAKRLAKESGKHKGAGSANIAGQMVKFEAETAAEESNGYAFMERVANASSTRWEEDPIYIVDSGASHHMVNNNPLLLDGVKPFAVPLQIIIGHNKALPATHPGRLVLPTVCHPEGCARGPTFGPESHRSR